MNAFRGGVCFQKIYKKEKFLEISQLNISSATRRRRFGVNVFTE